LAVTVTINVVLTIAVEVVTGIIDTIPDADKNVTPEVRVERLATCAARLVVTPLSMEISHLDFANSIAAVAVRINVAVDVLEPDDDAENPVEPQPTTLGVDNIPKLNAGSTSANRSPT